MTVLCSPAPFPAVSHAHGRAPWNLGSQDGDGPGLGGMQMFVHSNQPVVIPRGIAGLIRA